MKVIGDQLTNMAMVPSVHSGNTALAVGATGLQLFQAVHWRPDREANVNRIHQRIGVVLTVSVVIFSISILTNDMMNRLKVCNAFFYVQVW